MLSQGITFITGLFIKSDNTLSPHFDFNMILQQWIKYEHSLFHSFLSFSSFLKIFFFRCFHFFFSFFFLFFSFLLLIRLASHTEGKKTVIINRSRHQEDRRIKFRNYLGYRNYELSSPHIIERYEHRKQVKPVFLQ